jgi:hypothetical protein
MPHVILSGPVTPEDIHLAFAPVEVLAPGGIVLKGVECFLNGDRSMALIRALVVERGFHKQFFVRLRQSAPGELAISIEPVGAPERSDGVKRLLGLVARTIMDSEPAMAVLRTNIGEFVRPD